MRRTALVAAAAAALGLGAAPAHAAVRVHTVATGLVVPWEIAFMPNGSALVTERPGRVRLLDRHRHLLHRPVARLRVTNQGEGGLLGLALDPAFARNHLVYIYFTAGADMRLERWRWDGRRLVRQRSLVQGIQAGQVHDSGRIEFGPDKRLYIATGDAGQPMLAQDPNSLNGKFLALTPSQYRGAGGRPSIVSMGNRNAQGFDWQPGSGRLISTEHGPTGFDGPEGFDEINDIRQGGNYGWPLVIGSGHPGFVDPLKVYLPPIAPSGATFVTDPGSRWTGNFIFACLRGQELRRLVFKGDRIVHDEQLFVGRYGRLRDVVEGPGGALYVLTSNRDGRGRPRPGDDKILRIVPPRR
ncbi:MAG TPA: PQQ-dependent sugar dehydrogenase [Thermoleophilaceae bacterium]